MDRFNKYFKEVVCYDILYKDHYTNIMQIPKINSIIINTGIGKKAVIDNKHIFTALLAIELITGQKPIITRAKKWVDKFQLKKDMPIGCKVTLRHKNMNQFLDRLINRVLPRIEDFMGYRGFLEKKGRFGGKPQTSSTALGLPIGCSVFNKVNFVNKVNEVIENKMPNSFKWQQNGKRLSSHTTYLTSTSFGIEEKNLLTFSEVQYDQFDTLYGLDIIIVFNFIKNRYLSQPKYLLSAYQMPLC